MLDCPPDALTRLPDGEVVIRDSCIGCGTGELCAPRQPAPFEGRVCISKGGDQTCPAAGYTEKHVAFGEVFDGRSCSACTCEAAVGGSCTLSVNLYDPADGLCSAPVATVEADPVLGCVELPASVSVGHLAGPVSAAPSGWPFFTSVAAAE